MFHVPRYKKRYSREKTELESIRRANFDTHRSVTNVVISIQSLIMNTPANVLLAERQTKQWTLSSCLADHSRILVNSLPLALLAPFFFSPEQIETIESSVAAVNHSQLSTTSRKAMSALLDPQQLTEVDGLEVLVGLGKSFGFSNGYGSKYTSLEHQFSSSSTYKMPAFVFKVATAVCLKQYWMDLMGNTLLSFMDGIFDTRERRIFREENSILFQAAFFLYYILAYLLMTIGAFVLAIFARILISIPMIRTTIYLLCYYLSIIFSSFFIVPLGLLGIVLSPCFVIKQSKNPLASKEEYSIIPQNQDRNYNALLPGTFTTTVNKSKREQKVGVRFGSNRVGAVMVTHIKAGGLIDTETDLAVGDTVFRIGTVDLIGKTPKVAAQTLLDSVGTISIVASHDESSIYDDSTA